jgi:hypothetical protein
MCQSPANQAAGLELPTALHQAAQAADPGNQPLTSGALAQALIHRQIRQLVTLQAEVLAGRDLDPCISVG